jgi:hypothetical protein
MRESRMVCDHHWSIYQTKVTKALGLQVDTYQDDERWAFNHGLTAGSRGAAGGRLNFQAFNYHHADFGIQFADTSSSVCGVNGCTGVTTASLNSIKINFTKRGAIHWGFAISAVAGTYAGSLLVCSGFISQARTKYIGIAAFLLTTPNSINLTVCYHR